MSEPKPKGRPTKKTPELVAKLLQVLGLGVHRKVAAAACGIGESTLQAWLANDEELAAECERVEGAVEVKLAAALRKAAVGGDTRVAMWYLERRYPDRWGRRTAVEVQPGGEGTDSIDWNAVLETAKKPRPRTAPDGDEN